MVLQAVGQTPQSPGLWLRRRNLAPSPCGWQEKEARRPPAHLMSQAWAWKMSLLLTSQKSGLSHMGHLPAKDTGKGNLAMCTGRKEKRLGDSFALLLAKI